MLPPHRREPRLRPKAPHVPDDFLFASDEPGSAARKDSSMAMGFDRPSISPDQLYDASIEALAARWGGAPPTDRRARSLLRIEAASIATLALACLRRGGRGQGLGALRPDTRAQVVKEALASTSSDFAFALGSTFSKVVLDRYEAATPIYRRIARREDVIDFKPTRFMGARDFSTPLRVGESAERRVGSMSDGVGEEAAVLKYGIVETLSHEALVNDDAGYFANLADAIARRIVELEEHLVLSRLAASTLLSDGLPLFDSSRGNIGSAGALSSDALRAARAGLARGSAPDGIPGFALARFLVVPPESLGLAESILAATALGTDPDARIVPLASATLTGTAWYLLADPASTPCLVYGGLRGYGGRPLVQALPWWEGDGVQVGVSHAFVAAVASPRAWRGPGA